MIQRSVSFGDFRGRETVDHERHIHEVLPAALKSGNDTFENNWTFQQDGGRTHIHQKTQGWCRTHLPSFIDKDH